MALDPMSPESVGANLRSVLLDADAAAGLCGLDDGSVASFAVAGEQIARWDVVVIARRIDS